MAGLLRNVGIRCEVPEHDASHSIMQLVSMVFPALTALVWWGNRMWCSSPSFVRLLGEDLTRQMCVGRFNSIHDLVSPRCGWSSE